MTSAIASGTSVKMAQEALCYAECATLNFYPDNGQRAGYARILADLIADCKRQRPTGRGGKHDSLHTASCGCGEGLEEESWRPTLGRWRDAAEAARRAEHHWPADSLLEAADAVERLSAIVERLEAEAAAR